jgi:uncharacterized protein
MMRLSLPLAVALVASVLGGCASPNATFYTLSPEARSDSAGSVAPVTVVIRLVSVPELVDRPQIVVRAGDNQVTIDEFARWADPLKNQIPRVVADDLGVVLNSTQVSVYPIGADPTAAWRVQIDVQRFDATLGEAATVDVLWSVAPPGKGSPLTGRTRASERCSGPGYDALAAAYSRALATVSGDIAAAIHPAAAMRPAPSS